MCRHQGGPTQTCACMCVSARVCARGGWKSFRASLPSFTCGTKQEKQHKGNTLTLLSGRRNRGKQGTDGNNLNERFSYPTHAYKLRLVLCSEEVKPACDEVLTDSATVGHVRHVFPSPQSHRLPLPSSSRSVPRLIHILIYKIWNIMMHLWTARWCGG